MKKSFSGLGAKISRILAGVVAAVGLSEPTKSFNAPEANPIHRSGKSSGGRRKISNRSARHKAWHKLFGGLAVPGYTE